MPPAGSLHGPPRRQGGLTLLELIVTLIVGGILVAIAAPAFYTMQRNLGLDAATDRLYAHLFMARNHAVTHSVQVRLCARNGQECGDVDDWNNGWLVFEDQNANGTLEAGETLLRQHHADSDRVRLSFRKDKPYVYYKNTGLGWPNGTFRLCSATDGRDGQSIVIAPNGRPRFEAPVDAPVECENPR